MQFADEAWVINMRMNKDAHKDLSGLGRHICRQYGNESEEGPDALKTRSSLLVCPAPEAQPRTSKGDSVSKGDYVTPPLLVGLRHSSRLPALQFLL